MSPLLAGLAVLAVFGVVLGAVLRMRPRRFYFVRHGETVLNAQHIRQGEEGSLSEEGKQQAERVGEVLTSLPIERIIASPYPRAQETAIILKKYLKVPILYSPLLV